MPKKKILSVGFYVPSDLVEDVDFESKISLLDADIIIFRPAFPFNMINVGGDMYLGKPSLSDDQSANLIYQITHWRKELKDAFNSGKTIFVFLEKEEEVYYATGKKEHSGTGRNRQTTRIVEVASSYNSIPLELGQRTSIGESMQLAEKNPLLGSYWKEFSLKSEYRVLLESGAGVPLITTKHGSKVVGTVVKNNSSGGAYVCLPYMDANPDEFYTEGENEDDDLVYTTEAIQFGHRFLKAIQGIDSALKKDSVVTPQPAWVSDDIYRLSTESELNEQLEKVDKKLEDLGKKKKSLQKGLSKEFALKGLLYEKGKPLEAQVIEALSLLGFKAKPYKENLSEYDVVFESKEGRALGEVEGKDNKAINIDKLRQLEINVIEDYERDEVKEMAKGALFGNVFRLVSPDERKDFFTAKCMAVAKRNRTALVKTPDLFNVAKFLKESSNKPYAKKCREAIFQTEGDIVVFPPLPKV